MTGQGEAMGDGTERTFGEVRSDLPDASWAHPEHHSRLRAFREHYDGLALYYLEAVEFLTADELHDGVLARIDLDVDGWLALRSLCEAVLFDIENGL